jgi:hypothetical protein
MHCTSISCISACKRMRASTCSSACLLANKDYAETLVTIPPVSVLLCVVFCLHMCAFSIRSTTCFPCSPCFNMLPWNSRPVASAPPNQPYGHPHFPACSRLLPQAWLFIAGFAFLIGPIFLFYLHVISQVIIRRKSHTDKRRIYGKVEQGK